MAKREVPEREKKGVIDVKICSADDGLEQYGQVNFIRIKSRRYTLLIMREFMPVIGELEGDITISGKDGEISKTSVCGYFMHQHNQFSLMLKGKLESDQAAEENTENEAQGEAAEG